MLVRRELEKDAGWGRVDSKQMSHFGSVQLQSDPMGDLYHTGFAPTLTHLSPSPHLGQCSVMEVDGLAGYRCFRERGRCEL